MSEYVPKYPKDAHIPSKHPLDLTPKEIKAKHSAFDSMVDRHEKAFPKKKEMAKRIKR